MKEAKRNHDIKEALAASRRLAQADSMRAKEIARVAAITRPIIQELREQGYQVDAIADLRTLGRSWESALPILLRWLPVVDDSAVKMDIVRSLSVPWIGTRATAQLLREFRSAELDSTLAWVIGNALSIVDVHSFEEELVELASDRKYGAARQMIVLGLSRLRHPQAESTAIDLLQDEDVKLHAIIALGKMESIRALPELNKLLRDKRAVIRKEARKALTRITAHKI